MDVDFSARVKQERSIYSEEIASLKNWFDNIERVNQLNNPENLQIKEIDWMESIKPDFIRYLEDLTWRFENENDEDNAAKLSHYRFKALIWFALFNLQYSSEVIMKIIENADL